MRYNSAMPDSIFTKIIKGEIPAYKIYEDDKTLAFLDIHPVQPGHCLVISKLQVETIFDLPDEDYRALWQTVQKIARHMQSVFPEKRRIGIQVEGLDIPHPHVKLIPINTGEEFRYAPDMTAAPDSTALTAMAAKLAL